MNARQRLPILLEDVRACTICAAHLPHGPRPVLQVDDLGIFLTVATAACAFGLQPVPGHGQEVEKVSGVGQARIDFEKKTATVTFDGDKTSTTALVKATTDAGCPSTVRK